ncbi:argininosuccinate synthase domain-containing protein [Hydrogenimonas urashimensis]|uniref:argininosuccinate synthase domain-containing protein n=1 Tax=Hydrogenimonas urashimensis TaxID=2740515 RepID=UPI0019169763|nr:argininosuccinate synthase domain-containing protein [Hydrogenimonas urashimensis]
MNRTTLSDKKRRAIALFSGGLDSTLAIKLVKDQGIEVIALNIDIGFGSTKSKLEHMQSMCDQVGVELRTLDIRDQYLREILFNPKYGYGKNFNPCIDCHGNMFRIARELMEPWEADFLISGEVVGQRPMSQRRDALDLVTGLSETQELLLRPLSAKVLPPTLPECEGWVDREKLLGITGRNREVQLRMAEEIGLKDFEKPGGGCLLTDENFSKKLAEFIKYDNLEVEDIALLKCGRHLRLPDGAKLVIGRHREDNAMIDAAITPKYRKIRLLDATGPISAISANASRADKELAARLTATYGKTSPSKRYSVQVGEETFEVIPFESKEPAKKYFINL